MGIYFLLATLGSAVGLSTSDRMNPTTLQTGVVAWAFVTTIVALFIRGLVTSLFTTGENKAEAVVSGIITWALLFTLLLVVGGAGIRAGFNAMQGMANSAQGFDAELGDRRSGSRRARRANRGLAAQPRDERRTRRLKTRGSRKC